MDRSDNRKNDDLRPITFVRDFTTMADGSVLVTFGNTSVLCTASVDESVPRWMKGSGSGWVTAEYSMLPGSSPERVRRETKGPKGRTQEIQRLIGRSLRAVCDMERLGERQITVDCDVLQADGGTRTASITGAYVALYQALLFLVQKNVLHHVPLKEAVAATSVGILNDVPVLDLCYQEDFKASVDLNVVMTDSGKFVEIQGTAEESPFSREALDEMIDLASQGIRELHEIQSVAISELSKLHT